MAEETYNLHLDRESLQLLYEKPAVSPHWTELDFHRCPNCLLEADAHAHCPLALCMTDLIANCSAIISHETVRVTVITPERTITKQTTAQHGLSSIMGLIMPTSGCPHTSYFRPMARFHLPFATAEETIYRSTSMYLLAQYFSHKKGDHVDHDLQMLKEIYRNLHIVNQEFVKRLRAGTAEDSSVNALILLDLFTETLPLVIEKSLAEIRYLFWPFLRQESP